MNSINHTTDIRSNVNDQIANASNVIGKSEHRQRVFKAIYTGKKKIKTIDEICISTGLTQVQVLKAGGILADAQIVQKIRKAYCKDDFYSSCYRKVLNYAQNPNKLRKLPTKTNPKGIHQIINVPFSRKAALAIMITIDDIESFGLISASRNKKGGKSAKQMAEKKIKRGICKIIGESGSFKDWGGEKNDLYTTKIRFRGRRRAAAFAFKGKATKGILTLDKMGKRADQIPRLFDTAADIYLIVYGDQISPVILEQMKAQAISKALAGDKIFYGIVDGDDLTRLISAYPKAF